MSPPSFRHEDHELPPPYGPTRLIAIEIAGGTTTPEAFAEASQAASSLFVAPGRGLVLSGRAPVWGFAILAHLGHPSPWVATVDPRLNGAVVVQSHIPGLTPGTILRDPALQFLLGG